MITFVDVLEFLGVGALLAPLLAFFCVGATMLFFRAPGERFVARLTALAFGLSLLASIGLLVGMAIHDVDRISVDLGGWFSVGNYVFELSILVDRLSLPFMLLTAVLGGVIGRFSRSYLHRDPGYPRFFLLTLLFASGMLIIVMAGSIDLLFAGWELVGITSALLIAFFHHREGPSGNALRTFAVYRTCDVALLVAVVLFHHHTVAADYQTAYGDHWPGGTAPFDGAIATPVGLLLVLAAMGKSAQVPFSGWLPRAMEGPTPSSAIFYGGLSIHAGAYLLLRNAPVLERAPIAATALVVVGIATALLATLSGRAQADAKNQLAYASMAQVGLILAEIGLGLRMIALVHIAGHASVRTLQLLRAPSMLHDFHRIHAAAGGHLDPTGGHYEMILPAGLRRRLYALAIHRGGLDALLDRFVVGPMLRLLERIDRAEARWAALFEPPAAPDPDTVARPEAPVARDGTEAER